MVTGGSRSDFSLGATDANETNVSFWHFSHIQPALTNVRYWGKADMARTYQYVRL